MLLQCFYFFSPNWKAQSCLQLHSLPQPVPSIWESDKQALDSAMLFSCTVWRLSKRTYTLLLRAHSDIFSQLLDEASGSASLWPSCWHVGPSPRPNLCIDEICGNRFRGQFRKVHHDPSAWRLGRGFGVHPERLEL